MTADPNANLKSAPLFDHLEELRKRIVISAVFLVIGMVAAFQYRLQLLELVKVPLNASVLYQQDKVQLVTLNLTDQFILSLNLSFWAGLAIALPFMLTQVWAFIAPGLYDHERRWALPFIIGAGFSFIVGAIFGYTLVLPTMVRFLLDFLNGAVTPILSLGSYIGTVTTFLVAFGLSFELPILAVILTRIGIVNHVLLRKGWRIALVVIMVFAAIITPTPDPTSMLIVAVPLYVLYELGVILSRAFRLPPPETAPDETPALGL
ncbi:Sec-independent protein translocase protein TatC [Deinococcus seoulensis]|uniref:Sec-independent protein translocase protein TatC n=1 Tax=Deinococcus seoulensis TaxID=1837379 RepID=A0ABQ2RUM4_9DEIO|nr:twin-arginine translocase subunit TatC [Deinococcus seoulensis]GGR65979.1 Sec-independent protein translocase protein TatC [Deinococcus seoulensis]